MAAARGIPGAWAEAFANLSGLTFVATDTQLRVLHWPPAAELMLGWPAHRAVGYSIGSVLSLPSVTQASLREAASARATLADVVLPARRIGGVRFPLRASLSPVADADGASLGIAFLLRPDEPGEAAPAGGDAVAASSRLHRLLDPLPLPVALVDALGTVRAANEAARRLFGIEEGHSCCESLCRDNVGGCRSRRLLGGPNTVYWERESGAQHFDMTALPLALGGATPDHVLYFGAESRSQLSPETRKFYRAVHENMSGVVITDQRGAIEYANPRASEILGYSAPELVGRDVRSFDNTFAGAPQGGQSLPLRHGIAEVLVRCADDSLRQMQTAISDIRDEDGRISHWIIVFDDITARRRLEASERDLREQVAHAARLAAVGEIASMIAHEINQPLSVIANYARGALLRSQQGKLTEPALNETLEEVISEIERAANIVRNVRNLARRGQAMLRAVDLNHLLHDMQPTFRLLARGTRVRVMFEFGEALPPVAADPSQIDQVLVNLVKNAVEASADLPVGERRVIVRTRRQDEGDGVSVEVQDAAEMPSEDLLKRLGQPFFTTKAEGLGLGLSISRTLLEYHGTRLGVHACQPTGKFFHFELRPYHEPVISLASQ